MKVAIVGMGALGRVYGVRLALRAATDVTFVVRPGRAPEPLRLTRIDGDGASEELAAPTVASAIPAGTDAILVCVRAEQLDGPLDALLAAAPDVPIVMLTPALPRAEAEMTKKHGVRVRIAMPGVVAYLKDNGVCRYWLPRVAPTLLDDTAPVPDAVTKLVQALGAAGFAARLEPHVRELNPATTVSFIPLTMGIDAAGGIDALLGDRALLKVTLAAVEEGLALAKTIGPTPSWVGVLARFAGPTSLKIGTGIARRQAPEALAYVEEHFGRKLHAQNVSMARAMVALADEKGTTSASMKLLLERLERAA